MRRAVVLVYLAALAVALTACGGGNGSPAERLTKAEYEQELAALGGAISEGFESVGDPGTQEEFEAQIEQAQSDLNAFADRLDGLSPPEDIESAHEKLVEGLRQFSDDLGDISASLAEAAQSEDPASAFEILGQLVNLESVAMLQDVQAEFEEKGYSTGLGDPE